MNASKTLLTLGASSLLTAQQSSVFRFNAAIVGYKSKEKFVNQSVEAIIKDEPAPSDEAAVAVFDANCALGYSTFMEVGLDNIDLTKIGLSQKDLERLDEGDLDGPLLKKVLNKATSKYKFDLKMFWLSDVSRDDKPECTQDKVFEVMMTKIPEEMRSNMKLIKRETIEPKSEEDMEKCLFSEDDGKSGGPVCKTLDPQTSTPEEKERLQGCALCSINNGLTASAIGAAAMVAFALFF